MREYRKGAGLEWPTLLDGCGALIFLVFVDALDLSKLCLKVLFLGMVSGNIRFNGSMPSRLSFLSFSPTLFGTLLLFPD